jgi:hypothetical protein
VLIASTRKMKMASSCSPKPSETVAAIARTLRVAGRGRRLGPC